MQREDAFVNWLHQKLDGEDDSTEITFGAH